MRLVRPTLIALALTAVLVAVWWQGRAPVPAQAPRQVKREAPPPPPLAAQPRALPPVVPVSPPALPLAKPRPPAMPPLEVPIQDQATLDFSYGAPMVTRGGEAADALERSMNEINTALKDLSVGADGKLTPAPTSPPSKR